MWKSLPGMNQRREIGSGGSAVGVGAKGGVIRDRVSMCVLLCIVYRCLS